MTYVNAACSGHVTIFSTDGKSRPFFEFYALTLATRSYALMVQVICNMHLNKRHTSNKKWAEFASMGKFFVA